MNILTLNDLSRLIKAEIKAGNGDKKILVSDDEEGNCYHPLFFGFTTSKIEGEDLDYFDVACINKPYGVTDDNVDEFIILG